ncbi:hypothetical protein [Rhizobium laguerreae]|nr:hypothetical protein [Rhizobium laguerreae]
MRSGPALTLVAFNPLPGIEDAENNNLGGLNHERHAYTALETDNA